MVRHIVALETFTPTRSSSKTSQCSSRVRSGLLSSWEGSHWASMVPSLAGGPGIRCASTSLCSLLIFSQRFTEGSETPKILATSLRSMPRSMASNTLSLRSFEYAFIYGRIHEARSSRNAPLELRQGEVRRINLPRTRVNRGQIEGQGAGRGNSGRVSVRRAGFANLTVPSMPPTLTEGENDRCVVVVAVVLSNRADLPGGVKPSPWHLRTDRFPELIEVS
jgi:hypothetical protein